jgi:hypothetical protein
MPASSRGLRLLAILLVWCAGCGGGSATGGSNATLISTPTPPSTPTTPTSPPGLTSRKPQFAYTANELSGDISGFAVNVSSGALTPLPGVPISVPSGPQFITADAQGHFAFVAKRCLGMGLRHQSEWRCPATDSRVAIRWRS